jgi:ABC-2 type transport system permease protein
VAGHLPAQFYVVDTQSGQGEAYARDALRDGRAVVAVVTPADPAKEKARILIDGSELFAARSAVTALAQVRAQTGGAATTMPAGTPLSALSAGGVAIPAPEILFNPDLKTSSIMIPGLCGIILVFVGTVATALGVVRERQAGTLEQLAVMPFRARDVFVGKIAPYLLIAAVDMVVIVAAGMLLFGVPFRGSPAVFALGAALFLFITLGVGVFISTVSQTQGQAIQLSIMTLLPQILLSGLFFPLYAMPWGVRWIGYCLPLTYFIKIARGVMLRGEPLTALWLPFLVLTVMAAVLSTVSILRFRRDLAPASRTSGATLTNDPTTTAGVPA